MLRHRLLLVASILLLAGVRPAAAQTKPAPPIDLAGTWRVALDRDANGLDVGLKNEWFKKDISDPTLVSTPDSLTGASKYAGPIKLPGTLQEQGYGDEITTATVWMSGLHDHFWFLRAEYLPYTQPGKIKMPWFLIPDRHYTGVAWYQRQITIPESWRGRRSVISFERVQWGGTVWLGDQLIGSSDILGAPQVYDMGIVAPGTYRLTVRVDNHKLVNVRDDGHSVTDSTQTNWNGLVGKLTLSSTAPVWIDDAQVFANIRDKTVRIETTIGNATHRPGRGVLSAGGKDMQVAWGPGATTTATLALSLPAATKLWDEFNPTLQHLTLKLAGADPTDKDDDERELTYGLRELRNVNGQFELNGHLAFLRGTHEGCEFPLTGYPPTDVESWRKVFTVIKQYGLNHMRFHSWCPPEAAFIAADEMGVYLQPECDNWGQFQDPKMAPFLERETVAIAKAYGNHPSFLMLSSGNEGAGAYQGPVLEWANRWFARDDRRMYTGTTGRPVGGLDGPGEYTITPVRGNSEWHGGDFRSRIASSAVPVVSHEVGQYCAYPTFENLDQYTGSLHPYNYEVFRDSLVAHGMGDQAHDFTIASGKFQVLCYKEEIEEMLRTPGMGGFQLLDLHDYPGQGTAVVGVLDTFWKTKGYITAQDWRRFCSPVVPLARVSQWLYSTTDTLKIPVSIANFSVGTIIGAQPQWKVVADDGKIAASGTLPTKDIPLGAGIDLGEINQSLAAFAAPAHYKLAVSLGEGKNADNDWDIWVYPPKVSTEPPAGVSVVKTLKEAKEKLAAGGKVVYFPSYDLFSWESPTLSRMPIFWNTVMGPKWGRSIGLLIQKDHPALAEFPTDSFYQFQWDNVIWPECRGLNIGSLPTTLKPIVQPIDDWSRNFREAMVFEAKVGPGRLLVCTADLTTQMETRRPAKQLLRSLLDYAGSEKFQPAVAITPEQFSGLFFDNRLMSELGATSNGQQAIDGNPNTAWSAGGAGPRGRGAAAPPAPQAFPHDLTISFEKPVQFSGLLVLDRQDNRDHQGDIREYQVQVSDDGQQWTDVAKGELLSTWNTQRIDFKAPVTAKQVRLSALSAFGPDRTSAVAEISLIYSGPEVASLGGPAQAVGGGQVTTPEMQVPAGQ